jgi:hypothetical protein
LPEFQVPLDSNEQKGDDNAIFLRIQQIHHQMQRLIKESMPKIP